MSNIIVGSARRNEFGTYDVGKQGDQLQKGLEDDYSGEVSMQQFYVHKKGWYVLRPIYPKDATKLATAMKLACNNKNIGYSQNNRADIIHKGIMTTEAANCDCSSLVRACIMHATGKDVGNFTTFDEVAKLEKSGLFQRAIGYSADIRIYNGDVLVTKASKGHTVIVVSGSPRPEIDTKVVNDGCYPKYTGTSKSIYDALLAVGETDASFYHRRQIAKINGFPDGNYIGEPQQNNELLRRLKAGELKRG